MPKYKVNFKVAVQIDGWTNPSQDYDERIERGSVVVTAKNKTEARAAEAAKEQARKIEEAKRVLATAKVCICGGDPLCACSFQKR